MTNLIDAIQFWKCKEEDVYPFDVEDTFNPPNTLQGFLCRISDHRYGALWITSVNNIPCGPQPIWGTPKQHYPFDKNGQFHWPPCCKVNLYTKYDGTNILAYTYELKGRCFVTYKSRITPILRSGTFGDFVAMWCDMLAKYPRISDLVFWAGTQASMSLSFELYGARNKHLILYEVPLDTALLFGVTRSIEPRIVDPQEIDVQNACPKAVGFEFSNPKDLTSYYKKLQAEMEAGNKTTEFGITGTEGYVMYYYLEDGAVMQFKCKPDTIEKIHWSASGINKNVLRATIFNAYESEEVVTIEVVKKLLAEEFQYRDIEKWHYRIVEVMKEVEVEMIFRKQILEAYRSVGKSILEDKVGVMREMGKQFPKNKMKYVYWVITH